MTKKKKAVSAAARSAGKKIPPPKKKTPPPKKQQKEQSAAAPLPKPRKMPSRAIAPAPERSSASGAFPWHLKMPPFQGFYDCRREGVTQTLLSAFSECRVKALLMINRLHPLRSSAALDFGKMMHALLEEIYDNLNARHAAPNLATIRPAALEERALKVAEKFLKEYRRKNAALVIDPEAVQRLEDDCTIALAFIRPYVQRYREDFHSVRWANNERKFNTEFAGIRLRGRIDRIYQEKNGKYWIMEHKTAAQISPETLFLRLALDFQSLFYLFIADAKTGLGALSLPRGAEVEGVKYNIIRKPTLKIGKQESPKEFFLRLEQDIKDNPDWYFYRFPISQGKAEKKTFLALLKGMLSDFEKWSLGISATYYCDKSCASKKFNCQFLSLCAGCGDFSGYRESAELFPELAESEVQK